MRGFTVVALDRPKTPHNVGGILRSAGNFDVSMVVFGSPRCRVQTPADTMKAYRHRPVLRVDDVFETIPFDCVPVAVDLLPGAVPLHEYAHPERAFYVFGAEDATLGERITSRCRDAIYVPTQRCMNLAVAVSVVLYDRAVKRNEWPDVRHFEPLQAAE